MVSMYTYNIQTNGLQTYFVAWVLMKDAFCGGHCQLVPIYHVISIFLCAGLGGWPAPDHITLAPVPFGLVGFSQFQGLQEIRGQQEKPPPYLPLLCVSLLFPCGGGRTHFIVARGRLQLWQDSGYTILSPCPLRGFLPLIGPCHSAHWSASHFLLKPLWLCDFQ